MGIYPLCFACLREYVHSQDVTFTQITFRAKYLQIIYYCFSSLDQGIIWSTCNTTLGSFAGDASQTQHLKLSRFKIRPIFTLIFTILC